MTHWPIDRKCLQRSTAVLLVAMLAVAAVGVAASAATPLDTYVMRPEPDFRYEITKDESVDGFRIVQALVTSQRWQNTLWRHRVTVVVPPEAEGKTAVLYVGASGSGASELEAMRAVAGATKLPTAVVMDIPNQPLWGLREDALIAYTFGRFVQSQDTTWPLLLPMTKGAVKAMDAVQEIAQDPLGIEIDRFVVTGASKRGWTTWLTAAVDDRVIGIAPIVYNNLDLVAQMELQARTFPGGASPKIADYTSAGFHTLVTSPIGKVLVDIVDPYAYVDRYTIPKMLLHGTNDPYWPVDALNVYLDDLVGETYVVNFANGGHDLGDLPKAVHSIATFVSHVTRGVALPQVEWSIEAQEGNFTLYVEQSKRAKDAVMWVATGRSRDFTNATFHPLTPGEEDGRWFARPMSVPGVYLALYIDVEFELEAGEPLTLSTPIFVLEPVQ